MHDLIVIGGGAAGLTATEAAARLGARVLLIEKQALGGECLYSGCIPSKTLIRTAEVAHLQRTADRFGLTAASPPIDGARVMAHVREVVARVGERDRAERLVALGAEVRFGAPRFVSPDELELDGTRLTARAFILATGSRPQPPALDGLAEAGFIDNESLFRLRAIPRSLAVLGGGPVALELGQALGRLGARVTVIEALDRLLSREDPDCSAAIAARLTAEGLTVHTATRVHGISARDGQKRLACTRAGAQFEVAADELLVAVGRAPNVEGLELERAAVDHDARKVRVDRALRTSNPRIFAVGDLTGRFPFTHMAGYEGALAVRNALLPLSSRADDSAVAWAVFTAPEVARVGWTEPEARAQARHVEVLRTRFDEVDRAVTSGEEAGFVKLVAIEGRLAGAHIVGAHASELIHTPVLAMHERAPLEALARMIWVYPTLGEGVRKAAQSRYLEKLTHPGARRLLGGLRRLKRAIGQKG